MAKSGEFYTFDEVVRQLHIDENKLKRLVSEGEISAFREGDIMKFKRSEIDKLSTKGGGSETSETVLSEITLEDEAPAFEESGETLTDDLVFESTGTEDQIALGSEPDSGVEEISSQDTFIEDAGDEIGMTTEPIDLSADLTQEVEEEEIEEVDSQAARRGEPRRTQRRVDTAAVGTGSPAMTFVLVLCAIVILLGVAVAWKAGNNEMGMGPAMSKDGLFGGLSNTFYENFGTAKKVDKDIQNIIRPEPSGG